MSMSEGKFLAQTTTRVQGVFPPPGIQGELRDTPVRQSASGETSLDFGTDISQMDTIVCQDRALNALSSATYDLYTGTDLLDINNGTAAFRIIRYAGVYIVAGGDSSGVRVGGAASNEWVGFFSSAGYKQDIFPDACPWQGSSPAGKAVGSSTKNFKVENLGAVPVTVRIVLGGTVQVSGGFTGLFSGYLTYP